MLIRRDGRFLLASRPAGKPYASYWEFPGGKVEGGESVAEALRASCTKSWVFESGTACPWVVRVFDYPHALVRLHFFRVFEWSGELHAREHQSFGFFSTECLTRRSIVAGDRSGSTMACATVAFMRSVPRSSDATCFATPELALARGLKLLQFREPALDSASAALLFNEVLARVRAAGATLLVNSRHRYTLGQGRWCASNRSRSCDIKTAS